ncbi:hypothetical protein [Neptuniibacter sp. QD37_11]|uniref:hypothetical protein n=1 Tax=Neptuniibacter sp. QD37_11 TaxID=3398209 RepID=UPI0039F5A127
MNKNAAYTRSPELIRSVTQSLDYPLAAELAVSYILDELWMSESGFKSQICKIELSKAVNTDIATLDEWVESVCHSSPYLLRSEYCFEAMDEVLSSPFLKEQIKEAEIEEITDSSLMIDCGRVSTSCMTERVLPVEYNGFFPTNRFMSCGEVLSIGADQVASFGAKFTLIDADVVMKDVYAYLIKNVTSRRSAVHTFQLLLRWMEKENKKAEHLGSLCAPVEAV